MVSNTVQTRLKCMKFMRKMKWQFLSVRFTTLSSCHNFLQILLVTFLCINWSKYVLHVIIQSNSPSVCKFNVNSPLVSSIFVIPNLVQLYLSQDSTGKSDLSNFLFMVVFILWIKIDTGTRCLYELADLLPSSFFFFFLIFLLVIYASLYNFCYTILESEYCVDTLDLNENYSTISF